MYSDKIKPSQPRALPTSRRDLQDADTSGNRQRLAPYRRADSYVPASSSSSSSSQIRTHQTTDSRMPPSLLERLGHAPRSQEQTGHPSRLGRSAQAGARGPLFRSAPRYFKAPARLSKSVFEHYRLQTHSSIVETATAMHLQGDNVSAGQLVWAAIKFFKFKDNSDLFALLLKVNKEDLFQLKGIPAIMQQSGVALDASHYAELIEGLAAHGALVDVADVLRDMQRRRVAATSRQIDFVLLAAAHCHNERWIAPVFFALDRANALTPYAVNQALLLAASGTAPLQARKAFLQQMVHYQIELRAEALTSQLLFCAMNQDRGSAHFWCDQVSRLGIVVSPEAMMVAAQNFIRANELGSLFRLMTEVHKSSGCVPEDCVMSLVRAFVDHKDGAAVADVMAWVGQTQSAQFERKCREQVPLHVQAAADARVSSKPYAAVVELHDPLANTLDDEDLVDRLL